MIVILGSVVTMEATFVEALALSQDHVARSLREPGCLAHAVYQDVVDPMKLIFVEKWATREALMEHFKVPASRHFAKALAGLAVGAPAMELLEASPVALQPPQRCQAPVGASLKIRVARSPRSR